VDQSGQGVFSTGDLYTLSQLGIASIDLNTIAVNRKDNGNTIQDDSRFTWADGSTGDIASVTLAYDTSNNQQLIQAMASMPSSGSDPASTSLVAPEFVDTRYLLAATH
jgi:hypothetical protein